MDSYTLRQELLNQLVDLCIQLDLVNFVIAPGSRSAPLVTALAQRPELTLRSVIDERSAGYVALGMAQQLRKPVGLLCTSGTASLNFAPAITEAFYQRIPLLVLTADRPPEWIDQQDNQAIHQPRLYEPHILASFELPTDVTHPDAQWHTQRVVAQAIGLTTAPIAGPVHINIPLREPIYPGTNGTPTLQPAQRVIRQMPATAQLSDGAWHDLRTQWQAAQRKLVIAGMHVPDARLVAALQKLAADPTVAVIADITANLFPHGTLLQHGDLIWGSQDSETLAQLVPDLVISFGGQVVSKYWKTALRNRPPQALWQLWTGAIAPDPFQALTHILPIEAAEFFEKLSQKPSPRPKGTRLSGVFLPDRSRSSHNDYGDCWKTLENQAQQMMGEFVTSASFGEFVAVARVMAALPAASYLQLGNSMAIRYANLIGWLPNMDNVRVNSNRGTSGIDGSVSTAVGAALMTDKITTLIVGDLAFFYDRNGLWQGNLPPNLRIVLLNNHGGGIFDIIEGPNQLERAIQERFFLTPQPLTAERSAADHGLDYFSAHDESSLVAVFPAFFANRARARQRAAILEVETNMAINTQVFNRFKALVAGIKLGD